MLFSFPFPLLLNSISFPFCVKYIDLKWNVIFHFFVKVESGMEWNWITKNSVFPTSAPPPPPYFVAFWTCRAKLLALLPVLRSHLQIRKKYMFWLFLKIEKIFIRLEKTKNYFDYEKNYFAFQTCYYKKNRSLHKMVNVAPP